MTLIVESTEENLLDGPDNMTVARDGTIYLCEDGSSVSPGDPNYSNWVDEGRPISAETGRR